MLKRSGRRKVVNFRLVFYLQYLIVFLQCSLDVYSSTSYCSEWMSFACFRSLDLKNWEKNISSIGEMLFFVAEDNISRTFHGPLLFNYYNHKITLRLREINHQINTGNLFTDPTDINKWPLLNSFRAKSK